MNGRKKAPTHAIFRLFHISNISYLILLLTVALEQNLVFKWPSS